MVPPIDLGADLLGDGHGLARHHGLVDRAAPLDDHAVDRHLLARADPQAVPDLHGVELDLLLGAVRPDAAGRLGREVEQGPDGAARGLTGAELENLPEQDEHRDDGGRLEVHGDGAVMAAEGRREDVGRQRRDHAVDPRHAGAHRDQGEHVQVAVDERLPAAHEERPAGPEHDRGREQHLDPVRGLLAEVVAQPRQMAAHLQGDHGQGQGKPDPEAARHVDEFVARAGLGGDEHGLERHAADRAGARTHLPDLRDASGRCRSCLRARVRPSGPLPARRTSRVRP